MKHSQHTTIWIDEAIAHWRANGIKLQEGISLEEIHSFEKILGFVFPQDFIDLYTRINGFEDFESNEYMFSLWSFERILKEYREDSDDYISFCDFLINSYSICFYKSDWRIYKYNGTELVADTFKDFILLLNTNNDLLY